MRVLVVGGTRFVGPVAVRLLLEAGHEVAVAHTGAHEAPDLPEVEHLHGAREELLAAGGPVEGWRPEALVDTFAGGASAAKGEMLAEAAGRAVVARVVAVSSMDVYRHCVDAGIGDGSGTLVVPRDPLPLDEETSPLREGPYPGATPGHDNVAMEAALHDAGDVTALRPGTIYGPHRERERIREWELVERIARGERRLPLPDGGVQLFHRVAVERVGRAVVAVLERAPAGFWPCNVVDPYDWTYAGLAGEIARLLDWQWEPVTVPRADPEGDHPWNTAYPVLGSDRRLREVLGVTEPDPRDALRETVDDLWRQAREAPPS